MTPGLIEPARKLSFPAAAGNKKIAEVIFVIASMIVTIWICDKCGYENGPMRDVFCGNCGQRRPGW